MNDPKNPDNVTDNSDVELSEDELDKISGGVGKMTQRPSGYLKIDDLKQGDGFGKIPDIKGGTIDRMNKD